MSPLRDDSHDSRTVWAARAAALYTDAYAERYSADDGSRDPERALGRLTSWLRRVCEQCGSSIDVLDLGCGTGRYLHALAGVRRFVGIDASRPMLERARQKIAAAVLGSASVTLIEGDFLTHELEPGAFDLVYAIGVLAEHSPFDEAIARRVRRWLKPGGRFAFTTVHPSSASVPRTTKRRIAEWLETVAPAPMRRPLRARLMRHGLYADEQRVRDVLSATGLIVESIEPFESDVHLHVLAVAKREETKDQRRPTTTPVL